MLLHFQTDERKEAALSSKDLVVVADDGHLALDIGESHPQKGVECGEDEAKLVEDGTEGLHQDFLVHHVRIH